MPRLKFWCEPGRHQQFAKQFIATRCRIARRFAIRISCARDRRLIRIDKGEMKLLRVQDSASDEVGAIVPQPRSSIAAPPSYECR